MQLKKPLTSLFLLLAILAIACFALADDLVYGTATLTYAEYYAGDVSSVESIDTVSSATNGKSGTFPNVSTDFVDEATNAQGYHVLGLANVNVALPASQVEAYKAINPTFVETETVPAQYKPVSVENDQAVYGATVLNVVDTVSDAELEVVTDSHWGDYQVNVVENSTKYIRNSRSDEGFAVGSGIMGIVVETASGLKVGMEHLQSIWVQPWEISWNVTVDNTHNDELTYDNLTELDKLMGETITKITFLNQDDAYVYTFDGAYLPIKFPSSLTADSTESASLSSTYTVVGLPEDYVQNYTVAGLNITAENGTFTWEKDIPGAYTLLLTDDSQVYAKLTADFILTSDVLPVAYDADENSVVPAEGADSDVFASFMKNLSKAVINGQEYSVSGRGAVAVVDEDGEVDLDAVQVAGRGQDAVEIPVFAEGENTVSLSAVGFNTTLDFTVTK
ncbi:MAG: hypothetical protein IJ865_04435 [Clostridia bacterium]|nr:hypothetical protein [Clostridia bacterium]